MNVLWSGAALDPSGYGEATRQYLLALANDPSLKIKLVNKSFWSGESIGLGQAWSQIQRLHGTAFSRENPHVFVQHLTPENWLLGPGDCRYHIGMTTFETDSAPSSWLINMRAMDEIWTHSKWGAEVFAEKCKIRRPIKVIHHGVDTDRFNPEGEALREIKDLNVFTFGSNFDWTERKNPLGLLQAYYSAFKAEDPVKLVLKVYYQYPLDRSRDMVVASIQEVKRAMGLTKTPPIQLITSMLDMDTVPKFYRSLDAYVLPSRGEGWGLTFSEAMATGLPTIGVKWSGNTEFMTDDNSYLCDDFDLRDITREMMPQQPHYVGHKWADVNPEQLAFKMRAVYSNRAKSISIGQRARRDMVEKFTWAAAAQQISSRLAEVGAIVTPKDSQA